MLGLKWKKVKLLPHDEAWNEEFLRTKSEIALIWGENVLEIEHVGSTAICNICSKPMFAKYPDGSEEFVTHHIHIYEPGNQDYINLVGFRDYLNSHPEAVDEYNAIKAKAADENPDDRFAYSDAKRKFIEGIIELIQKR